MFGFTPILLYFLVLFDVQTSNQERQKCNGVISVCLQNTVMLQDTVNLSQLYISSKSNETKVRSLRRKSTSRIHKKNRRKNFQRKVHRHSTRVLSLKPASILLPPFENDIQQKNVSTLNPFIINVLANSKTSIENLGFSTALSDQQKINLNKPRQDIISTPESELNSTNSQEFNIMATTEHYKSPIIVPPSGPIRSDPESGQKPTNFQFLEAKVTSTLPTEIESTNPPPPPFLFLLPPFQEIENNILETQILEKPDDLKLPGHSTNHLETSSSFSSNKQTAIETSSTSLLVYKEFNQTASYYSHIPVTTTQSIFDDFNKTKDVKKEDSHTNFNNTLLAPEVASLGMKIVTSRKGLEMIKELVTSTEPKSSTNHLQYDDSQSLLETAESGDIRSHTYNQILSIEEAKDVPKNMYKALKKPQKGFELCSSNQGYVADQSSGCQVFYICLGSGIGEPMMCPNGTLFNQEVLVCDWWYNVECSG